jgi:hypothetical protein
VVALGRKPIHLKDGREVKPEDGPVSIASRETLRIDCKYPECKCHFMHFVCAKNPDDLAHMVPSSWGAKDYEQLRRNLVMYGYNRWDIIKKDGLGQKSDADIVNHADSTLLVWRSQLGQDERRFIDFLVGDKQAAKAITIDCKHLVMKDITKFQRNAPQWVRQVFMHHQLQELQRRSPNLDLVRSIPDLSVASGKLPSWWNVRIHVSIYSIMYLYRDGQVRFSCYFRLSLPPQNDSPPPHRRPHESSSGAA